MKDIPAKFNAEAAEEKWYRYWMEKGFFRSVPDHREPYTIVIPPPNVTGVLHMGHMLNNTLQDVLVRRARMKGKNACWVPGTDHASIATEAKVVAKLKAEGIEKASLTREDFLRHAWEWKEKHGGIILEQLKKLGASCDWERTSFTMDEQLSESVLNVFIDLYKKGLIYRGVRMVNWDPQAKTAVSDEEVLYREEKSKLYHVKYQIEGINEYIVIATTRPETILGDTAVCVHPEDERYTRFKGKNIIVPMVNRVVPLIFDAYVDREFGTGALKVTPAHDINDYELGIKHNLVSIDIFNEDGTLNEKAELFIGTDRFEARTRVSALLQELGQLVKVEDYMNKVGVSERTQAVIEPRLSMQWFLRMKDMAKPALDHVMNDDIALFPPKFKNTYRHWMENVKDWCISRQLWWGHRIPAYYLGSSHDFVVAANLEEAFLLAKEKRQDIKKEDLRQDEDVLDTWFSSWLWPISVFDGIRNPENPDIKYYYPTNDLITAPEILFFWVARMIMAGYEYAGDKPFKNVYLTGIVRDKQGRKMSKSLGNSPDPIELMKKYSADGVRVGMLLCSAAGNDLLFDESLTEQGRNFGNKIWNAFRLIQQWEKDETIEQPQHCKQAVAWFSNVLDTAILKIEDDFTKFRISEALMEVYRLFWDDFSSWYLEIVKPAFGQPMDARSHEQTQAFLEKLLRILHPFMPFITEELWQNIADRKDGESLMNEIQPEAKLPDSEYITAFESVKEIVAQIRAVRSGKNLPAKETLRLIFRDKDKRHPEIFNETLCKIAYISDISESKEPVPDAATFLSGTTEYFIPLGNLMDAEAELKKLEGELNYYNGFLESVMKKLSNEKFVNNAPANVVQLEQAKKADAEQKISAIREQMKNLQS